MTSIGSNFLPTATGSGAQTANDAFNQTSETYLQLFLAEIKHQDPTEPVKTSDLTASLSQLTNSQQLIEVNKSIEELVSIQNNTNASSVSNLIGKDVQYTADSFYYDGEGDYNVGYMLDNGYAEVNINIYDDKGDIVYSGRGEKTEGFNTFKWTGIDKDENQQLQGKYTAEVFGVRADETSSRQKVVSNGNVTAVDFTQGSEPILFVNNGYDLDEISLGDVGIILDLDNS